jgi:hypothetical protein
MSFQPTLVIPFVFGVVLLVFARAITNFIFRHTSGSWFNAPLRRSIVFVWTFRAVGILSLIFVFITATRSTDQVSLNWDRNQLKLLENGVVKQGKVKRAYYGTGAPAGWKVFYKFDAKDPETGEAKTYMGSSEGPKKYYHGLSLGEAITVIYDPSNPKLNCEIRCFINHPAHRHTFKKASKLNLLNKFKGICEIESYTYDEWYGQQQVWKK